MDRRGRIRGRHCGNEPVARSGVHAARHLLRLAPPWLARRTRRRHVLHLPGTCHHHRAVGRLLGLQPADLDQGCRVGRGCSGGARCDQCGAGFAPGELAQGRRRPGPPGPLGCLCRRRRRGRRHRWNVARPRPAGLRTGGGDDLGRRAGIAWHARNRAVAARGGDDRRPGCAGVGGLKSGGTLFRRRVRDHPPHPGRCRAPLPLDDQRPISQRGGSRPDHAGAGRADRVGRRLCRRGPRRRVARCTHCILAVVHLHSRRRPALRRFANQSHRAIVSGRCRSRCHRRHCRCVHPARTCHCTRVASVCPRGPRSWSSSGCDAASYSSSSVPG